MIPTAIRIEEARKLAEATLDTTNDGGLVSAVYVYRTQVAADPGGRSFYLCHELHEIENPKAKYPIRGYLPAGFTFVISPVVGRAQNVEPILTLKLDDGEMQLKETHLEIRGHLHYFADARKGGSFAFDRPPNIAVTYVLRKKGRHERHDFAAWPTDLVLI